jgi:sorbitol-specific phosphotransferase system component IIA
MRERNITKLNISYLVRSVILVVSLLSLLCISFIEVKADGNPAEFTSVDSAAPYVREKMKNRETGFTVRIIIPRDAYDENENGKICDEIMSKALKHTGIPNEGDYLRNNFSERSYTITVAASSTVVNYDITFDITYFTTSAQEKTFEAEAKKVLDGLNLYGLTDYEKVSRIYQYIVTHVTYDKAHRNDDSYLLKQSAYASLVNKTSVCQGYASLFYYMSLSAGVDSRIVQGNSYDVKNGQYGEAHAWNIVAINGKYFYLDSTWDAGVSEYVYFLKGVNTLQHKNGVLDDEINSVSPDKAYDMSLDDYWNYRTQNGYTRIEISNAKVSIVNGAFTLENENSTRGFVSADVTVTLGGRKLVSGMDYKVGYDTVIISADRKSGECTARIEGIGGYQAVISKTFALNIKYKNPSTVSNTSNTSNIVNTPNSTSNSSNTQNSSVVSDTQVDPNTKDVSANDKSGTTEKSKDNKNSAGNTNVQETEEQVVKVGYVIKTSKYTYKITSVGKKNEVKLIKAKKNLKTANIPVVVKINGKAFKVTEIGASAFKNNKKLGKVIISKNIKTIGSKAFSGCKKLNNITITSKSLKKIGANAFKGTNAKAKVYVPKGKVSKYGKLLRKAGLSKKSKITR